MAVDGGMVGLLNKFADHFDVEKTPPEADFRPLVREIPVSVVGAELPEFFEQLPKSIDGRLWYGESKTKDVFNEVFNLSDEKVVSALTTYLKSKDRDLKFLDVYPNRLTQLSYSKIELRQLWKARIFGSNNSINPFNIYSELVRNELIPENELADVHGGLYSHYDQRGRRFLPKDAADIQAIVQSGFYTYIFNKVIIEDKLKWVKDVNSKCDLIASLVENCPLQEETVIAICSLGNEDYRANWLINEIERLFKERKAIQKTFNQIAAKKGIDVPDKLQI